MLVLAGITLLTGPALGGAIGLRREANGNGSGSPSSPSSSASGSSSSPAPSGWVSRDVQRMAGAGRGPTGRARVIRRVDHLLQRGGPAVGAAVVRCGDHPRRRVPADASTDPAGIKIARDVRQLRAEFGCPTQP
ncbi:hypothetical protein NKG94_23775 [Micromonospora sp. M12]